MDTNVIFEYGIAEIMDGIDGEISRHAAFLRFQDGGSAYDSLVVHTNERPTVEGFAEDAFRSVLSRFDGEGKYENGDSGHRISFYLPDFDDALLPPTKEEIKRYVLLSTTAEWLANRAFPEYAKIVSVEAGASMNRLVTFLRTRKFPFD